MPAAPFAQVAQEYLGKQEQSGNPLGLLAEEMGCDKEWLRKVVTGKREMISFSTADKIICICAGGRHGWDSNADLAAIYQDFSFEWLDRVKPCVAA